MRNKKKVDKKPAKKTVTKKPVELKLKELEIMKLNLYESQANHQRTIVDKLKLQVTLQAMEYQREQALLKGKMRESDNSGKECRENYNGVIRDIEKRLDLKMNQYIVADDGTLTHEGDL